MKKPAIILTLLILMLTAGAAHALVYEYYSFAFTHVGIASEVSGPSSGVSIPEPVIMLLLGTGLIGLAGFGRKKMMK